MYDDYDERLLEYIENYVRINGVPPTLDDMIVNVPGKTSKSTIHARLKKMVEAGDLIQKNKKGYYYPASIDNHEVLVPVYVIENIISALPKNHPMIKTLNNILKK